MSYPLTVLVALSISGLMLLTLYRLRQDRDWRTFAIHFGALLLYLGFLRSVFQFPSYQEIPTARDGTGASLAVVLILYVCMLLGMLAQHGFSRFQRTRTRRKKFDLGVFLAPIFASPIVFIPLLAALQNADLDLSRLDATRMMLFFVAFQNGFFWKEYMDHKREEIRVGDHAVQSA